MRVVLYVHHSLFEPALSLVDALSSSAEVHVILEVPAGKWQMASFEATADPLPPGLVAADEILAPHYPAPVRSRWRKAASFHLISFGRRRRERLRALSGTIHVLRWIRALDADLLHVDDVDISLRMALALAVSGAPCPTLMGCHDPDPHSGERHWVRKRLARHLAFARVDAVLVHHEAGRSALRRRRPRLLTPIHLVRLATYSLLRDLDATRSPDHPGDQGTGGPLSSARPTVLLFGRMTPYKGIETLFEAAPRVAAAVPGVRFLVAGRPIVGYRPPAPPRLDDGGSVDVEYDYVPNTRIAALFGAATVVVCPYTDASQSGVVLTSYAFGCPVVATDVGGLPEYVKHGVTGLVVPVGDVDALVGALVACLADTGLNGRLRAGVAAANAGDLSWRRAARELLAVYEEVARNPSSP